MSRTNENKLKMKDIATIGIFSALLFVVTMVPKQVSALHETVSLYAL